MRIKNTNNLYSNKQIREIIQFVKPVGISNFDVMIKNSKPGCYAGRAYYQGSSYHSTFSPFITIRVGKIKFPYFEKDKRAGYLCSEFYSQTEILVHLIAHELRHLWQYKHPKGWRVYGARGQFSERDADAYAIHKLREWRRE
jgi:hypothetical protein